MALDAASIPEWTLKGELILNCNCTVFWPCVVSLGQHAHTEGYCQAWVGIRIDEGTFGDESLSGPNVGLIMDIPGNMGRGNWKATAYVDERASDAAFDALVAIFSGAARGTTGLFGILVSEFGGAERAPVTFETKGVAGRLTVGKKIQGEIVPVTGNGGREPTITNTDYWMGSDITVATATLGGSALMAVSGTSTVARRRFVRSTGVGPDSNKALPAHAVRWLASNRLKSNGSVARFGSETGDRGQHGGCDHTGHPARHQQPCAALY